MTSAIQLRARTVSTTNLYYIPSVKGQVLAGSSRHISGEVTVLPPGGVKSGDVNLDNTVDISDALAILGDVFQGQGAVCRGASDFNGDKSVDISDVISLLGWLFMGGTPSPADRVSC
jgi:hypothetical protein